MRGAAVLLAAFAAAAMPPPVLSVSAWAQEHRWVPAESGSPYPGKWDNARTPHIVEFMDVLGMDHPARVVAAKKSAQSAFSEAILNGIGRAICVDPCPILVLLPSVDEQLKYNRLKLQPMIDATPALTERVAGIVSRDESSATTSHKPFRGGFLQTTTASSSKGLQMMSARLRVYEEVSEYPADVDGRGEPTAIADARSIAWKERGDKAIFVSTPGLKGSCRVTAEFEAGDQRRLYCACPHCGQYQSIRWQDVRWQREDRRPYGAHVVCQANGCIIESTDRQALLARQAWLSTFASADPENPAPPQVVAPEDLQRYRPADVGGLRSSEGRHPSFAFWQVTSPFVPWDEIVHAWLQAQGDPLKLKAFWQQWLGEPWEVQGEAPEVERLLERRQKWPRARIPAGVLFLTGAVDVQGDRLEWAVYGWDRGLGQYLIDAGVIAGNPESAEPWLVLDGLLVRTFTDAWGKPVSVEAWGVDSGYLSQQVYRFVARHASTQRVRALDGRPGWRLPAMGTPKTVSIDWQGRKVGSTQLWPVGTYDLKSEVYWALEQTVKGPDAAGQWPKGAFYFGDWADRTALEQLTAEYVADRETSGRVVKEWRRIKGRANEQLDLAVYARALARLLADPLSEADWDNLKAQRLGRETDVQLDFAQIWAPALVAGSAGPDAVPSPASGPALPAVQRARGVRSAGVRI